MEILIAVLCFLVIYLGQTVIYRKYWDQGLSLDLDFDDRYLEIGDKSGITETITNRKMLPLTTLHVKFSTARSYSFRKMRMRLLRIFIIEMIRFRLWETGR